MKLQELDVNSLTDLILDSYEEGSNRIQYTGCIIVDDSNCIHCDFTFYYPYYIYDFYSILAYDYYHMFTKLGSVEELKNLSRGDWTIEYFMTDPSFSRSYKYGNLLYNLFEVYVKTSFLRLVSKSENYRFSEINLDLNKGVKLEYVIFFRKGEYYLKCNREYSKHYK